MRKVCLFFFCLLVGSSGSVAAAQSAVPAPAPAAPLTAAAIMERVAANQDSAQAARRTYVYLQHARVASRKGSKIMCEEITDSRVTPTEKGSHQQMLTLKGKLLVKGKYVEYTRLPGKNKQQAKPAADDKAATGTSAEGAKDGTAEEQKSTGAKEPSESSEPHDGKGVEQALKEEIDNDSDMDRDMVENMRDHMVNDTSKDGIGNGLFPLTSKNQKDYEFKLLGRKPMNGHDTYHLEFSPKNKDDFAWKGEAYIDTEAFQPVFVRTTLSRKIPASVRILLGTNVPGLGFAVSYARQSDGLWFPESFGTEFKVHVLFFFRRDITISARNSDFERTHAKARIVDPHTGDALSPEPEDKPQL